MLQFVSGLGIELDIVATALLNGGSGGNFGDYVELRTVMVFANTTAVPEASAKEQQIKILVPGVLVGKLAHVISYF